MIIQPGQNSGLDHSEYSIKLNDVPINLQAPKAISSSRTLSGGASIAVFEGNIAGERREITINIKHSQYVQLQKMLRTGNNDWLFIVRGRIFNIVFDIPVAAPVPALNGKIDCILLVVFKGEESEK